jgi:hypothetical protein
VSLGLGSAKVTLIYRILHIGVEDWIPDTTLFFSRNVQHRFMSRRTYEKKDMHSPRPLRSTAKKIQLAASVLGLTFELKHDCWWF